MGWASVWLKLFRISGKFLKDKLQWAKAVLGKPLKHFRAQMLIASLKAFWYSGSISAGLLVPLILFFLLALSQVMAFAQAPEVEWERTFGGSGSDWGMAVQQTSDGGYIIAGRTDSFGAGSDDVYLIKTDPSGNLVWQRTFGGSGSDWGVAVQQTSDGGYIIAGSTDSFGAGSYDVYLIKTNSSGILIWQKTFGGPGEDRGFAVQETKDGGYIICGSAANDIYAPFDIYLIKTDHHGDKLWERTFGDQGGDLGLSVLQTQDGGYIITGSTATHDGAMACLIKTDDQGNKVWEKEFGAPSTSYIGASVIQTSDGGYVIAGTIEIHSGNQAVDSDIFIIRTDAQGDVLWERVFEKQSWDMAFSVQPADGGFVVGGHTEPPTTESADVYLIRTDAQGNKLWEKTLGRLGWDSARSVYRTLDGGYIVAGTTDSFGAGGSDVYLIKLEPEGGGLDVISPNLVQDFSASDGEDGQSTLSWTNPPDNDLAEVVVRRKTGGYPSDHTDGDLVYQDTSPTPGASVEYVDTDLVNGTTYYYAVFSCDTAGNWNDQVVEGKNADTATPGLENRAPIARASDISGQPGTMYPEVSYAVTVKYFDPDGREDLKYCYLRLDHPEKPLTMMWYQEDGHAAPWAGEEGENYLTRVEATATEIVDPETGYEGYEIAWTFEINEYWPEAENAIDFGVCAVDDGDSSSGWDYNDTNASFRQAGGTVWLISVTPNCNVLLVPDTCVAFSIRVGYELWGREVGFVEAEIGLPTGEALEIGKVEISHGVGEASIEGEIDVNRLFEEIPAAQYYLILAIGFDVDATHAFLFEWECLTDCPYLRETGTLVVTVKDAGTGLGIQSIVEIDKIEGLGSYYHGPYTTTLDGSFSIQLLPGAHSVRVWAVGHDPQEKTCEVRRGETTNLEFSLSLSPIWRRDIKIGDILYDPCALAGIGHVGIYVGYGKTVDPRFDGLVHDITTWDYPNRQAAQILRVQCPNSNPNCARDAAAWALELVKQIEQDPNRKYCYQCPVPSGFSYLCGGLPGKPGEGYCTSSPTKNASITEDDWYCSELVWAAYFNQHVNIENDRDQGTLWWLTHSWDELEYIDPIRPHEICDDNRDVVPVTGHLYGEPVRPPRGLCGCEDMLIIWAIGRVDAYVTDPSGLRISRDTTEIANGVYWYDDLDDLDPLDVVVSLPRQDGTYQIQLEPRQEEAAVASATGNEGETAETYSLIVSIGNTRAVLVDCQPIQEIPAGPFQVNTAFDTISGHHVRVGFCCAPVTLEFSEVIQDGNTEVTALTAPSSDLYKGFTFLGMCYEFVTTAVFRGPINVEISYDDVLVTELEEKRLRLFKITEEGTLLDITDGVDTDAHTVFGHTESLSCFVVGYSTGVTADITSPSEGDAIRGKVEIIGTAAGTAFAYYTVDYGEGRSPESWNSIRRSSEPVTDGILATWDTSGVDDGEYTIRLTVVDTYGVRTETAVRVLVDNTPPVIQDVLPVEGDFVSAEPTITATLTDNLSGIDEDSILLKLNGNEVNPAPSFDPNTGKMTWTAQDPLPDGTYEVTLDVKDKAGNAAEQARTSFTVQTELAIAQVLNYPNPCSSGTTFTYNLSQEAQVRIEIYTLAGELIKVIGPASGQVGYNEQYWDGTDDHGFPLDNGVYIYRIVAEADGKVAQAIGRLVILR